MYNMPLAFGSIMAILCSRMNLKREMWAFKIISTRNNKYVIGHLKASDSKLEKNAFDSYIDESSDMLTVGRTEFVSDYASRSVRPPKNKTAIGMLIPLVVLVAIVFLVVEYYRTSDIIAALTAAQLTLMMGLPLSAFFTFSFPFYKASKSAFGLGSAIIGESSLEEYSSASVISFSDKDVFPAQGVKVRSMKLYGNSRIDHILYKTASVFGALGGPLSDVFMVATKDLGHSGDVDIVEITANGVEAAVDGEHVFVGSADYIRENGYVPTIDAEDREVEYHGHVSIMYVAIAGELSAKMYIEYKMDPEIEDIIKSLCKSGMCLGIRTFDPNIDDSMLDRRIKLSKYPVRVLKCSQGTEMSKIEKRTDSGIVSKRSAKNLLKTLTYCDKVLQIIKTNIAVKIFSIIASIIAVGLIIFFGGIDKTNSLYVLLFQIFWMIPMAVIAALFV